MQGKACGPVDLVKLSGGCKLVHLYPLASQRPQQGWRFRRRYGALGFTIGSCERLCTGQLSYDAV